AADQLDEDVDIPLREGSRIVVKSRAQQIETALAPTEVADPDERDFATRARGQIGAPAPQQPDQRGTDCSEPCDADAQRFRHSIDAPPKKPSLLILGSLARIVSGDQPKLQR